MFQFGKFQKFSIRTIPKISWTYESLKKEIKIEKIDFYQKVNMRIDKIASSAKYRMNEKFQNCQFFSQNYEFPIWIILKIVSFENSKNFQVGKFQKFLILRILKCSSLENSKNFQFRIIKNVQFGQFQKFPEFYVFGNH